MKQPKIKKLNYKKQNHVKYIIIFSMIVLLSIGIIIWNRLNSTSTTVTTYTPMPEQVVTPSQVPIDTLCITETPQETVEVITYIVDNKFDDTLTLWLKPNIDNTHMCLSSQFLYNGDIVEQVGEEYVDIYGNIFIRIIVDNNEYWIVYYSVESNQYYLKIAE